MGTLDEGLALTILRNFQLAKLDATAQWEADLQARASAPPTWSWTPGTFVFPEGLCCYCGGVMRSPAIWRAENLQFYGSWKVVADGDGTGHFAFDDSHPHVNSGSICMGSSNYQATSVADALFLAFNPLSTYFHAQPLPDGSFLETNDVIKAWFDDRFNHRCGFRADVRTIEGIDNRHLVAPEPGCHCQHCRVHRGEVHCPREDCGEWFNPREGHGRFRCSTCNPGKTRHFCFKHKHERRKCVSCGEHQEMVNLNTGQPIDEELVYITPCPKCEKFVCDYCLNQSSEHARSGRCGEDEEEVHDPYTEDHYTCEGCDHCICECVCEG